MNPGDSKISNSETSNLGGFLISNFGIILTRVIIEDKMSQHSEESDTVAKSDSFWEPGNYKRTVKRSEDGFKLCNDLIALIQERAEAEKNYAKSLKTWSKKWSEIIEKGPEYGTMEAAWKAVLEEADRRCDMHLAVKDNLLDKVSNSIKQWQKDSYHKSMMTLKEKKEFEDAFKKVAFFFDKFLFFSSFFFQKGFSLEVFLQIFWMKNCPLSSFLLLDFHPLPFDGEKNEWRENFILLFDPFETGIYFLFLLLFTS